MHSLNPLVSFNSGEWAPTLDARTDLPNYRKACRKLRNMMVMKQGGVERRPGTAFVATGMTSNDGTGTVQFYSRMEKFQYAPGVSYMLEFGSKGIRFYLNGVQLQASGVAAWVSGTSYPNGAFVTYGGFTWYNDSGAAIINSTVVPGADSRWVVQTAYQVPTPYSAYVDTPNPGTPWSGAKNQVWQLEFEQTNDVIYITHPLFPVYKLTRYADTNWVMQEVQFLTPALLDQNATDMTLTAGAVSGSGVSLTASAIAWATSTFYAPGNAVKQSGEIYQCVIIHTSGTFTTDLANGYWKLFTTFTSQNIGSYWQLAYNRPSSLVSANITSNTTSSTLYLIGTWEIQTYGTWNATLTIQASYDNGVTWQTITSLTSAADANYNITGQEIAGGLYRVIISGWVTETSATTPRVVLTADNQFVYGLVLITAVADDQHATCTVINPAALYSTSATIYWSEGAWSDRRGYPQAITIFQERVWYGATTFQPQRLWATQINDIENFALIDQSQATYGLAFDLNAPGRGPIQWLTAQTDLCAGLAGAEWFITSGQPNVAISPTAVIALEHSANGSAPNLPGLVIGNATFYVQRRGSNFEQMLFSVFTNKYMSQEMQVLAQHLTAAGIKQFDYQQQFENQSLIWAVCGDGSLISMNYAMDQEVFGWSKHTTGDDQDDSFISVQVIYGQAGQDDEVWVSVNREPVIPSGITRCSIERINPVDWQTYNVGQPDIRQAVYSDCSLTVTSPGSNTISGLSTDLDARLVDAMIVPVGTNSALVSRNLTVSAGAVTIPYYVPQTGDVVTIGLPINWQVQPMRLDVDPRLGQIPSLKKAISRIYPRTVNSLGGMYQMGENNPMPFTGDLPTYLITQNSGAPLPVVWNQTYDIELPVGGVTQYDRDPQFSILGSDPLPFTLLALSVEYDLGAKA